MLITDIDTLRTFNPASASFSFPTIEPFIKIAERDYIIPIIGQDEYDILDLAFNAETTDDDQDNLIRKIQDAIAWISFYEATPVLNVHVTAGGFQVAVSDNMAPASQYRVEDYKAYTATKGYNALENILYFLWNSDAGTYPQWEESDEHDTHRSLLVLSSKEFQKTVDIKNSYEVYTKLKPFIQDSQLLIIRGVTGEGLYNELLNQVLNNTISTDNEVLMQFIRPCLCYLSMADALVKLSVIFEAYGIIQLDSGQRDNIKLQTPTGENKLSTIMLQFRTKGQHYETKLRNYLKDNPDDYPLYVAGDSFEDPALDDEDGDNINDQDSGFFVMM